MNAQVTVELPEDVLQRATRLAQLTSRPLADILVDTLNLSLPVLAPRETAIKSLPELSDKMILQLLNLEMDAEDDRQLSQLLHQQQAGKLSEIERLELAGLMQIYQDGLLRKAQALAEAVKRGLHPPLSA